MVDNILEFKKPVKQSDKKNTQQSAKQTATSKPQKSKSKSKSKDKSQGKTLCKSGFHKWQADTKTQFDVKQGKLVTRWVCSRCGKTRIKAE